MKKEVVISPEWTKHMFGGLLVWQGFDYYGHDFRNEGVTDAGANRTEGVWFSVNRTGEIHRLFDLNDGFASLYVGEGDALVLQKGTIVTPLDFNVQKDIEYEIILVREGGHTTFWAGEKFSTKFKQLISVDEDLQFSSFGTSTYPTPGGLPYGTTSSGIYYYWCRALSEKEVQCHAYSRIVPKEDETCVYASLRNYAPIGTYLIEDVDIPNLFCKSGEFAPDRFGNEKGAAAQYAKSIEDDVSYDDVLEHDFPFLHTQQTNRISVLSCNAWMKLADVGAEFSQFALSIAADGYDAENALLIREGGHVQISMVGSTLEYWVNDVRAGSFSIPSLITAGWHMLTMVCGEDGSTILFVDGAKIGEVPTKNKMAWLPKFWKCMLGSGVCIDDVKMFDGVLTERQVEHLFELEQAKIVEGSVDGEVSTVDVKQLLVRWNAVCNAEGYRVYRATSEEADKGTLIAEVGSSVLSYIDSEVEADTTYYYRIEAYNAISSIAGPSLQIHCPAIEPKYIYVIYTSSRTSAEVVSKGTLRLECVRININGEWQDEVLPDVTWTLLSGSKYADIDTKSGTVTTREVSSEQEVKIQATVLADGETLTLTKTVTIRPPQLEIRAPKYVYAGSSFNAEGWIVYGDGTEKRVYPTWSFKDPSFFGVEVSCSVDAASGVVIVGSEPSRGWPAGISTKPLTLCANYGGQELTRIVNVWPFDRFENNGWHDLPGLKNGGTSGWRGGSLWDLYWGRSADVRRSIYSAGLLGSESNCVECVFEGPGYVRFGYRVTGPDDVLEVCMDGVKIDELTGVNENVFYPIGQGSHTFRWIHRRSSGEDVGDGGWVRMWLHENSGQTNSLYEYCPPRIARIFPQLLVPQITQALRLRGIGRMQKAITSGHLRMQY